MGKLVMTSETAAGDGWVVEAYGSEKNFLLKTSGGLNGFQHLIDRDGAEDLLHQLALALHPCSQRVTMPGGLAPLPDQASGPILEYRHGVPGDRDRVLREYYEGFAEKRAAPMPREVGDALAAAQADDRDRGLYIREQALAMARETMTGGEGANGLVAKAKVFEAYLQDGMLDKAEKVAPLLDPSVELRARALDAAIHAGVGGAALLNEADRLLAYLERGEALPCRYTVDDLPPFGGTKIDGGLKEAWLTGAAQGGGNAKAATQAAPISGGSASLLRDNYPPQVRNSGFMNG